MYAQHSRNAAETKRARVQSEPYTELPIAPFGGRCVLFHEGAKWLRAVWGAPASSASTQRRVQPEAIGTLRNVNRTALSFGTNKTMVLGEWQKKIRLFCRNQIHFFHHSSRAPRRHRYEIHVAPPPVSWRPASVSREPTVRGGQPRP